MTTSVGDMGANQDDPIPFLSFLNIFLGPSMWIFNNRPFHVP